MKQLIPVPKLFINSQQAEVYQRIQAFYLDTADAHLSFSQRLARDNGWTIEYTQRVIDEYKKFIFLAVVAEHPVTPSDQVDVLSLFLIFVVTGCALSAPTNLPNPLRFSLLEFTAFYLSVASIGIVVINLSWLFRQGGKSSKTKQRSLLFLTFSLLILGISKIATGISNLPGQEFLGFYLLATVTGLLLDFFARSRSQVTRYTRRLTTFDKAVKLLTVLSVWLLYLLGLTRIILGVDRDKPVGYLVILCSVVGIQILFLLFSRFTENFSDSWRILLAIPVFLSIPFFLWLGFKSLGLWMFFGLWMVIGLLQGSNSSSSVRGGGDSGCGDDGGDSGCGDGGDSGCGGCGGCGD